MEESYSEEEDINVMVSKFISNKNFRACSCSKNGWNYKYFPKFLLNRLSIDVNMDFHVGLSTGTSVVNVGGVADFVDVNSVSQTNIRLNYKNENILKNAKVVSKFTKL